MKKQLLELALIAVFLGFMFYIAYIGIYCDFTQSIDIQY